MFLSILQMGVCGASHVMPELDITDDVEQFTPRDQININKVNYSGTILVKLKSGIDLHNDCMSDRFSEIQVQRFRHIDTLIDSVLFDD